MKPASRMHEAANRVRIVSGRHAADNGQIHRSDIEAPLLATVNLTAKHDLFTALKHDAHASAPVILRAGARARYFYAMNAGQGRFLPSFELPFLVDRGQKAALTCEGVIHDFTRFKEVCEIDRKVVTALANAIEGSNRPLVVTSGTALVSPGRVATEDLASPADSPHPRVASEQAAEAAAARGVRACVLRLWPSVHGETDRSDFVPMLINLARAKGFSAYIGEGAKPLDRRARRRSPLPPCARKRRGRSPLPRGGERRRSFPRNCGRDWQGAQTSRGIDFGPGSACSLRTVRGFRRPRLPCLQQTHPRAP
jgi:hypothetical protein